MKKYLTYDDVNIVPKYSELNSRDDVDLTTRFTKNKKLHIPIVASPMDTVTEEKMAIEMLENGGVGFLVILIRGLSPNSASKKFN